MLVAHKKSIAPPRRYPPPPPLCVPPSLELQPAPARGVVLVSVVTRYLPRPSVLGDGCARIPALTPRHLLVAAPRPTRRARRLCCATPR